VMALGVRCGDEVEFVASGAGRRWPALEALAALVTQGGGEAPAVVVARRWSKPTAARTGAARRAGRRCRQRRVLAIGAGGVADRARGGGGRGGRGAGGRGKRR